MTAARLIPLLIGFVAAFSESFAADAPRPVRIMPVGDSITEGGKTFVVYRKPLLEKLTAAGFRVEYVGSRTDANKLAHEGYGGKNVETIAPLAIKAFKAAPADVVLIHAGHNHFAEEKPVAKMIEATESMIAAFRQANPRVTVCLAQVIPSGKLPKYSYIPDFNRAVADLAGRLDKPDQRVILVNQAEGFDPATDTIDDKVHPNAAGAAKMAAKWFTALQGVLPKGR